MGNGADNFLLAMQTTSRKDSDMASKIKAKRILQLSAGGLARRSIAKMKGFSEHGVMDTLNAAAERGVSYEDVAGLSDEEVYALLFPDRNNHEPAYEDPDWDYVHRELAKAGVTLRLLHSEYADRCADSGKVSMGYDRFCKSYRRFTVKANVTSRVGHKAGRTCEVDWSGPTMAVVNPATGEVSKAYLFVGVLPFSRYAYVEATLDMKQDTWLLCHVHMFSFFGGSAPVIVPDNLKTGVARHPREGEVVLNSAYEEMAAHYGAAIMPGRVRKPRDKPSAENTVWNAALAIIAPLRDEVFTSIDALQAAVAERLDAYNSEPFQKRAGSRRECFESEEKALLRPLPAVPYEICTWEYDRKVQRNCHVAYKRNFYSVSHLHVGEKVDLRVTDKTLEVYMGGERLATHRLLPPYVVNEYSTVDAHMPKSHAFQDWDAGRIRRWALRVGPCCAGVVERIFQSVRFEEQGYNPCLAVLRLTHRYPSERVERACGMVLESGVRTPKYAHIKPILETGQDKAREEGDGDEGGGGGRGYVRGADYYGGIRR